MTNLHRFANPARFQRLAGRVYPWAAASTALLLAVGLYWALVASPADFKQKETVRIMYIHVPAAYMALLTYTTIAALSLASLVWRHPLADVLAKAAAPIGAAFTFVALATGSLWGKPMWGAWWVWDARLTSMLILFFLYLGHIALSNAFDDAQRGARSAAVLALFGFVNVPIIHYSVEWWSTLHQPAGVMVFEEGRITSKVDTAMLWPLGVMCAAFTAYFVLVLVLRARAELLERRLRVARMERLAG